ncbi:MAG TPA: MBL fold metallo-hydrolase [Oligoflexus sp.]|uniref:MBL fold metallo-hydrolase n=1 Tax=Oligoflexus sp. TaxID=1971216 RepID=UPI002D66CC28|nr:MBL fold metallo-hydrolase [Oligoflexus sp.]HYX38564.1 MBL fold metallo-hydrolase [Oligoflexus sp.]
MSRIGLLVLLLGCRTDSYQGPPSDHFDGERFFQPGVEEHKGFLAVLRWRIFGDRTDWPDAVANVEQPALPESVQEGEVFVTFINHATLLIQLPGLNILTDPVWSDRVSPVSWAGPKRVRPPGLAFEKLPPIHAVLVSHNHYDHLDVPTLQRLSREHKATIIVPLGDKVWLEKEGIDRLQQVDWGHKQPLGAGVDMIFTPSQHWSARGLFDRNRSLWGSYLLQWAGKQIYFGGDTGYGPHFKAIQQAHGRIWLAMLPIGAYEPRWFMKQAHMNPEEAVQAHLDLQATRSLGIHYGSWQLTDEGIDEPVRALDAALHQHTLPKEVFEPAVVGRTYRYRLDDFTRGG